MIVVCIIFQDMLIIIFSEYKECGIVINRPKLVKLSCTLLLDSFINHIHTSTNKHTGYITTTTVYNYSMYIFVWHS